MLFLAPSVRLDVVQATDTLTLTPSDDVWVYPHASDPARDETVRVWGAGGRSVALDAVDAEEFAYGYLRFTLPARAKGQRLVGATLELTNVPNDDLDADEITSTPLEVRPLVGGFDEKTWNYALVAKAHPDAKALWGRATGAPVKGAPIKLVVDLMSKDVKDVDGVGFSKAFAEKGGEGTLDLALTSGVDVANVGMKAIYKVYTKETSDETRRPRLVLRFGADG